MVTIKFNSCQRINVHVVVFLNGNLCVNVLYNFARFCVVDFPCTLQTVSPINSVGWTPQKPRKTFISMCYMFLDTYIFLMHECIPYVVSDYDFRRNKYLMHCLSSVSRECYYFRYLNTQSRCSVSLSPARFHFADKVT